MKRLLLIAVVGLVAVGGTWWWLYSHGRCGKSRVEANMRALNTLRSRWADVVQLAGSSSRLTIGQHVGKLQDIRREVESLDIAPCAGRSKMLMLDNMNSTIEYMTNFMRGKDENEAGMRTLVHLVKTSGEQYVAEVGFLGRCEAPAWMPECSGR